MHGILALYMNFEKKQFRKKMREEGKLPPNPEDHWDDPVDRFDSQPIRDEMAQAVKEVPKEERKAVLAALKKMPEYHRAQSGKMRDRSAAHEQILDEDGFDSIHIKKKILYHGSPVQGIEEFNVAGNSLYAKGVYLTSEARDALGYTKHRMSTGNAEGKEVHPVLYRVVVEDMKMLDFRNLSLEKSVALSEGFKEYVYGKIRNKEKLLADEGQSWKAFLRIAEKYNPKNESVLPPAPPINQVAEYIRYGPGLEVFTNYLISLGYDGLVNYESEGRAVGLHDAYVVFDPKRVTIEQEQEIDIEDAN